MISTLDVAFVPFRNLLFRVHLKRKSSASLFPKYTHGGFLTHLALPAYLWHVYFHSCTSPYFPFESQENVPLLHSALVQVHIMRRVRSIEPIAETIKNPRASKRLSRDPSTNLGLWRLGSAVP